MKNMKKKHNNVLLQFDRILALDLQRQVAILVVILFVVFLVSFMLLYVSGNDWQAYCEDKNISKWVFPLYLLIDGNAFNSFYGSSKVGAGAVFMACLIYLAGTIIFTGMLISVMTNMIERRVENYRSGHLHYLKSGHYIIMGFDEMVPSFIHHIWGKDPNAYILILSSANAEYIREKLSNSFGQKQMEKIIFNYGHRTTMESYQEICLDSAEEVFVVGYHSQPAHDAINVECVDSICKYLGQSEVSQKPNKITCVFKDLDTYSAFKTSEIFGIARDLGIEFIPYNFFTGWAKQVFVKRFYMDASTPNNRINYPTVYGDGITPDDPRFVHLVFVGTTNFAVAFAMEAANVLHFPNFNHNSQLKTRITFIDLNADKEKDEFITRNRHFFEVQSYRYQDLTAESSAEKSIIMPPSCFSDGKGNFLDVEFEFIKGDIFSENVQREIRRWAIAKDEQYLSIFLAMVDQRKNFAMGMNMPDEVYNSAIPIFIRQDRSDNFVTNLRKADSYKLPYTIVDEGGERTKQQYARYAHIYPFGMNETTYSADDKSLRRAKLINYLYATADYESYSFQDLSVLESMVPDTIRSEAETKWNELSVALKWSNLYSSYAIRTKLATLRAMRGLKPENKDTDLQPLSSYEIEQMAQVEHNRWNVEKLLMGFRKAHRQEDKYMQDSSHAENLMRNKKLFIHHDIRPFGELDAVSKLDMEFSRYIPWIMKMTEL
jgi:hypothetical protein